MFCQLTMVRRNGAVACPEVSARSAPLVAVLLAVLAAPAGADRPLGIDVSGYETISPSQWTDIRNAGYVFSFARASYGWGGTDSKFVQHMDNAQTAGLYTGAYHFSYPMYSAGNTATNEAETFLGMARDYIGPGHLRPVLDVEWNGAGLSKSALSQWANDWMNYVQQQTGVEPMIYCNTNYAVNYLDSTLANRTLWIANWNYPDPQSGDPPIGIFSEWLFWQHAGDVVSVDGLTLDLDVFNGTLAQLQALVGSNPEATIACAPMTLSATILAGQNAPDNGFTIANTGGGTLNYTITVDAAWLSVSPTSGTSTGEADPISVSYSTALLDIGTYAGTIQIAASNSTNSPQTVVVTLTVNPVPGDLDRNGNIDFADVNIFQDCMTGPGASPPAPNCQAADIDHDGDVDQSDFGILQRCLSGTGHHPDPACAG
jgi:GH25 family lysozyme M1 (1,4-beta-N-acetylmuramidase)